MKRLLSFLILTFVLFFLAACQSPNIPTHQSPPTIIGAKDIYHVIGDPLPDYFLGIEAFDGDVDITHLLIVDDAEVILSTPGTYELTYHVTNTYRQTTSKKVYVVVLDTPGAVDLVAPVILGPESFYHYIGDPMPDLMAGVSAFDDVDGFVTHLITYDASMVDFETTGVYDIIYLVEDTSKNQATLIIPIEVIDPMTAWIDTLHIYYINDTHGAIFESGQQMGMANIGNLILDEKQHRPSQTLFLGGGDLLQGTMISNYFNGASMMHVLDEMQMDAFVIGNHEFDWGLEVVTDYFNPDSEGLTVNFPLLGANVFIENTTIRPDFIDPYAIFQKGQVKVGVIGLMGYGLESSIATSRIAGYYFADPIVWTAHYAKELREDHQVDVVLAVIHGASDFTNQGIGNLTGLSRVDAVFNGHTHQASITNYQRSGLRMPIMQSGGNGNFVGRLTVEFNQNNQIKNIYADNLNRSNEARLNQAHPKLQEIIDMYYDEIEPLLTESIIKSGNSYSRNDLSEYMAKLIMTAADAHIGIHNYGGTRAALSYQQDITVATLYTIFPFDNKIKVSTLRGSTIKQFILSGADASAVSYEEGLSFSQIQDDMYYKVASNDYVFDKPDNPFIYGDHIIDTGILIRDILEVVMRHQAESDDFFYIDLPIVLSYMQYTVIYFKEERQQFS